MTFGDASFVVQYADPSRLFVEARLHKTAYAFVVLHAPCIGTPVDSGTTPHEFIRQWWEVTAHLVAQHVGTSLCWILVDANAPLDAGDDVHVGSLGAEPLGRHTDDFAHFLQVRNLCAPSTFPCFHKGQTTWTHATGSRSRKDYILLPVSSVPLVVDSWVEITHDNTFAHEDHLPVALTCKGWLPLPSLSKPPAWDDQALLDPHRCQLFRQALASLPLPTWDVNADDHTALLENQLLLLGR